MPWYCRENKKILSCVKSCVACTLSGACTLSCDCAFFAASFVSFLSTVRVRVPACVWLIDLCARVCVYACVHVELACSRWEEECQSLQQDGAAGRSLALKWKGLDDALRVWNLTRGISPSPHLCVSFSSLCVNMCACVRACMSLASTQRSTSVSSVSSCACARPVRACAAKMCRMCVCVE